MSKIPGLGEIHEGIIERDPLDDTYQIRCLGTDGHQEVIRLQEVFAEYAGRGVRFTIAFAEELDAHARRVDTSDVKAVTLDDLSKVS